LVLDKRCLHNVSRIIAGNAVAFGRKSCDASSQDFRYCAKREKGTQREGGRKGNFEYGANPKKGFYQVLSSSRSRLVTEKMADGATSSAG